MDYTWQSFGRELIVSQDLDPIYVMLAESGIDDNLLKRWLLAYWCYYHAGVASKIAESKDFYKSMRQGIEDGWPRGMERRYFYGRQARDTVQGLVNFGTPEQVVDTMTIHSTFAGVSQAVQEFTGFGPWLAWKCADMSSCVLHYPVDFSNSTLGIYKDPVQGAAFVMFGDWKHPITDEELQQVVDMEIAEFSDLLAPPYYDRPIDIREVETCLCKAKSSNHGHYPMGNDTVHVRKALVDWGDLAQELLRWCPVVKSEWLDGSGKLRRDSKVVVS